MKKLTIILAIFFAVSASAQTQEEKRIADSIYKSIPDSIGFVSKRHFAETNKRMNQQLSQLEDKLTVAEYKRITSSIDAVFSELISLGVEDYMKRKKPVK